MLERMLLAAGGEEKLYVEDVFSTYLYTGNGSTQTITNGIDLAGKGGMVWLKGRSESSNNAIYDTVRGAVFELSSNSTASQTGQSTGLTAFNGNGFSIGSSVNLNNSTATYASWTFREEPKFFDVVRWNGTGVARAINHNLGVAPGCILVKRTTGTATNWIVYSRGLANTEYAILNMTAVKQTDATVWNSTTPTATDFTVGTSSLVNGSATYVAYLFAHDVTSDGIIQCGSFTTNSSATATINLGWEPQWLLTKPVTNGGSWRVFDNMRGWPVGTQPQALLPDSSVAEAASSEAPQLTSTGFTFGGPLASTTYIYIAIRRGPMKTPTVGTSVFAPVTWSGDGTVKRNILSGFPTDAFLYEPRNLSGSLAYGSVWFDRLRGAGQYLISGGSRSTDAEGSYSSYSMLDTSNGWKTGDNPGAGDINSTGTNLIGWFFRRAPGFFDVVCYTGTGSFRTVNHNLRVAPELIIIKRRSGSTNWPTYHVSTGNTKTTYLNLSDSTYSGSINWNNTTPTSTTFSTGYDTDNNGNGFTYVAYLFASCPGVSKVGSYTGNGSSQTINCGFSSGARFFLVKASSASGNWWVYDSARGIVAAADPTIAINTTNAEVTSADAVDTNSTGIIVNQEATCNINVNGATYIYLAIA